MARLVHLAGPMIQVRARCRQRCAWCGTLIQDIDLSNIEIAIEGGGLRPATADDLPVWEGLVAIEGAIKSEVEDSPEPEDNSANVIPADSCMAMPVEETT